MYISERVSLETHLKHVHRHMCDTGLSKMSVSVMSTAGLDDSSTTEMHGSNQTLHNMFQVLCLCVWQHVAWHNGISSGGPFFLNSVITFSQYSNSDKLLSCFIAAMSSIQKAMMSFDFIASISMVGKPLDTVIRLSNSMQDPICDLVKASKHVMTVIWRLKRGDSTYYDEILEAAVP